MSENKFQSSRHVRVRGVLRVAGPAFAAVGLIFLAIGLVSFFSAFGGFEPPHYFWCAFIGLPLIFIGSVMSMYGYLGAFQRYIAEESAPVAKDVVNYMGENIQPGVKAVSKAVAEGIIEAQKEQQQQKP